MNSVQVGQRLPPGARRWWPILSPLAVVAAGASLLWPSGRHQWAVSLLRQPARYTVLSFSDAAALPAAAVIDKPITVSFTVGNHEGRAVDYRYILSAAGGERSRVLGEFDEDRRRRGGVDRVNRGPPGVRRTAVPHRGIASRAPGNHRLPGRPQRSRPGMISGSQRPGRVFHAVAADLQPGSPPAVTPKHGWAAWVSAGLIAGANVLAISRIRLPFLGPAAGFWFLVAYPVYLLSTTSVWRRSSAAERIGYSLAATLLLLMLAGLGVNTLLPLLGVQRPLGPVPVVLIGDMLAVSLYLFREQHPAKLAWRAKIQEIGHEESRLLVGSGLCVACAALGANRLNNGAGDQLSLVALTGMVAVFLLLLRWQSQLRDGMTSIVLYLLSLALLLMNSLRGWYVTGHDIQEEYQVFQLTAAHGRWNISYLRDAYNACLSITILPTEVSQIAHVDDPYVYKFFLQVIFAFCPVLVYTIARRYWSGPISALAAIYFVGFPTFFTDMPFLNRQEIAFVFVCVAMLAITNIEWGRRRRRLAFFVACLGVELSHYSTMYFLLGTLLAARGAELAGRLILRRWRRPARQADAERTPWGAMAQTMAQTVGMGSVLVVAAMAFLWGDLATQTAGGALTDAESVISALTGSSSARAGDVSYSLLGGGAVGPQTALNDYRKETLSERAGSASGTYEPAPVVARYRTSVVSQPSLPLTGAGRFLADLGVPVEGLNGAIRDAAAKGEQLFVGAGLITFIIMPSLRQRVGREFFRLCVGSTAMVAVITLFPNLSVDYGVLRAFQEALILLAPVLVAGSLAIFSPLGQARAPKISTAACLGIFISTTGLLPQVLGGYPAQLGLNNSGQYYDVYYVHPEEVAAVNWLAGKPGVLPNGIQAEDFTNRFMFNAKSDVNGSQVITDIYPTLVRQSSWIILGYSNMRTGQATSNYDGDLLTYGYPMGLLRNTKNLVYNNGGAEIYR